MRVHELAKELGLTSKELLLKLKDRHIEAKSHMANLDEDVVKLFLEEKASVRGGPVVLKRAVSPRFAGKERRTAQKPKTPAAASDIGKEEGPSFLTATLAAKAEEVSVKPEAAARVLKPLEVDVPISIKDLAQILQARPWRVEKNPCSKA